MRHQTYCSDLSLQGQEPIYGTATPTSAYLLLEYPHAWGAKAIPESDLSDAVKSWFSDRTQALPDAKALLIRGDAPSQADGIRFYVAAVRKHDPALYEFRLEHFEDLLGLDLPAILAGDRVYRLQRRDGPLLLVCTHGRRDVCCARQGLPVYRALRDAGRAPEMVWQVSHVGGHRFAANVICLPHGLLYGRVDPENALAILDAARERRLYLPNLRGRSAYEKVVQAAEYYLRAQSGEMVLDAYRFQEAVEFAPDAWRVQFAAESGSAGYRLELRVEATGAQVYQGCKLDKAAQVIDYHLEAYEVIEL